METTPSLSFCDKVTHKKIQDQKVSPATSVPAEVDVVVLGGGSLGCNALYHLAKLGITNTVLLEAHQLTAGTTWHTAGLLWRLRPSDSDIHLINTTRKLLLRLEEETGINPGWINNGGLFIASTKERLDEYKRLMTMGRVYGIESYVLDPAETKKLYPLMNVEDLYGTLYCPGDGTMDPAGICNALTRWATRAGACVAENCPVTDIRTVETILGGRKVSEVHTPFGVIKTNAVINATGCWANDITGLVGVEVPLVAMKHAYIVTEKIPGIENMPNVRDHNASVYLRLQGDALSVGGYESNPIFLDRLDKEFAFGLYELDWDVFSAHIDGAVNRVPVLETTGIKSTVCGPESFTPDHKPIMGEDPNVQGFYHCCGFNSSGMMLGGGCGDQIARWVAYGRPDIDMFGYDIRRFHPPLNINKAWVLARSHESYAKNYSIVFPHDEPLAGRGQRQSPLHQVLADEGCVFQERHGWERPGWFNQEPAPTQTYDWYGAYDTPPNNDNSYKTLLTADYSFDFPSHHHMIQRECLRCRETAAIFDMSYFGKFYLTGNDAQKAADWLFSADVSRAPGTTVYTCMLNHKAGIEADLTVSICEGGQGSACDPTFAGRGFYLAAGGAAALQNLAHVLKEVRTHQWDVEVLDHTENMAMLSVQGLNSRAILQQVTEEDFSDEAFPFSTHKVITIAGHKVRALRLSFVGEMGWELHIPNASAVAVYEAVMAAGKPLGLVNAGYRAIDSLSCEKGYRHWHADVRPDDTPLEAGLAFTCKLKTDTQFLGREALELQKSKGISKKLVTFTLDDPSQPLWGLEGIWRDGEPVGHIRRAEFAFTLGQAIAYGYVQRPSGEKVTNDFLKTGTWQLESMGKSLNATVHIRPPFDPKNLRVKGIYESKTVIHTSKAIE
ncbi:sarcosine dehydrogenase, mitochondrial-like [Homarus americanus]|uniref:sarcosine dehydrogenase, mitochondrial-like n=1 Tax=Homarus americanus TaxID=6706 RepID=UPI001C483A5D|nr:sarcosine dehydrogenase, mitochondrial-like [Homarus americanus]